jgi:hypothetical protein
MLSSLTTLIPVLSGPNYQSWAPLMTSFLMSQGQHWILKKICPTIGTIQKIVTTKDKDRTETSQTITIYTNEEEYEEWQNTNGKAVRNIRLRLHHTIQYKYRDETDTGSLWDKLEKEYGNSGIIAIYLKFKAALETRIPDNANPSPAFDKILTHIGHLTEAGITGGEG